MLDKLVTPILLYGSELYEYKTVKKAHLRFCKLILRVRKQTPNVTIYGELGSYPIFIITEERALNIGSELKKKVM